MDIILASNSPRRMQLLSGLVQNFEIIPSTIKEEELKVKTDSPIALVKELSFAKGIDVFHKIYQKNDKQFAIISADTLVCKDDKILGKPIDKFDAARTLTFLQGTSNDVYTGMTVILKKENSVVMETVYSKSTVYLRSMSSHEVWEYVNSGEPLDKAGSYAIQGIGKRYVESYDGDYNSIVGLDTKKMCSIFKKYEMI